MLYENEKKNAIVLEEMQNKLNQIQTITGIITEDIENLKEDLQVQVDKEMEQSQVIQDVRKQLEEDAAKKEEERKAQQAQSSSQAAQQQQSQASQAQTSQAPAKQEKLSDYAPGSLTREEFVDKGFGTSMDWLHWKDGTKGVSGGEGHDHYIEALHPKKWLFHMQHQAF